MGVPINYGTCSAGPYNGKQMADHRPTVDVFIDRYTRKTVPGTVAEVEDVVRAGNYVFEGGLWAWRPDSECANKCAKR